MTTLIQAQIDDDINERASAVLATIGLTSSDAFRLMMVRIATEQKMPFEPLVPNAETIAAMKAARQGDVVAFDSIEDLMAELGYKTDP